MADEDEDYTPKKAPRTAQRSYFATSLDANIKPADNMRAKTTSQLNVIVDREWHRKLKGAAVAVDKTLTQVIYEAVDLWYKEHSKN